MTHQTNGIRKSAILVGLLDRRAADELLARLDPETARRVREAAASLGSVAPEERAAVLHEFLRGGALRATGPRLASRSAVRQAASEPERTGEAGSAERLAAPSGRSILGAASGQCTPNDGPEPPRAPTRAGGPPFASLSRQEADRLRRLLGGERPQTIALVLSHLPPEKSARVLSGFPPALMVDVVRRLVDLEETDPEILLEVEAALSERLAAEVAMQPRRVAGWEALRGIVSAADPDAAVLILDRLAEHDRALADRLAPPEWTFDDLADLDPPSLALVFRRSPPAVSATALIGASPGLVEALLAALPRSEAEVLRRRLEQPGPLRLSDIEEARRQMAEIARRLALERRIGRRSDHPRSAVMVA